MKVFIDTNVILDRVLFRDEPNFSSAKIFEASATGKIDGYIAALSFSHIAYILRKRFSLDEIREMYIGLCTIFNVVGLSKSNIIAASRNRDFTDFEDCLQYENIGIQNECFLLFSYVFFCFSNWRTLRTIILK